MYALVLVAMSIILSSAYLASTINYIPFDKMVDLRSMVVAETAVAQLEPALNRFMQDIRDTGANWTPPGDFAHGVLTPFPTLSDVTSLFAPGDGSGYGFLPAAPKGYAWSVGGGVFNAGANRHGVFLCLSPISGQSPATTFFEPLRKKLPVGSTFVANSCGALADLPQGTHFTYWKPFFPV